MLDKFSSKLVYIKKFYSLPFFILLLAKGKEEILLIPIIVRNFFDNIMFCFFPYLKMETMK